MATRVVELAGWSVTTSHQAHADLAATVSIDAAAARTTASVADLATTAAITATASQTRTATASVATTATITATASVTPPVDISHRLVGGTGTYGPGYITLPETVDAAYVVDVSDANVGNLYTPGVEVRFPTPSAPGVPHWLVVVWNIENRSRRVYHKIQGGTVEQDVFEFVDGLVTEAGPDVGDTSVLTYSWSPSTQRWSVTAAAGDAVTRDYLADTSQTMTVYFSPEAQASGSWSTIESTTLDAVGAVPSVTRSLFTEVGVVADVASPSGDLFECAGSRGLFTPTYFSGIVGLWGHPFARAFAQTTGGIVGRALLHELGHALDHHWMTHNGTPYGIDPVGSGGDLTPVTYYSYYPAPNADKVEWATLYWGDLVISYTQYDLDGTVIDYIETVKPSGFLRDEQTVRDLYASLPADPGNYYRSNVNEWNAQCLMLCWADHVPGYDATTYNSLVTGIGGAAVLDDYKTWAESIGVLPSSW